MSASELIKQLEIRSRYLDELEIKKAHYGIATPPHILLEIEELKAELVDLQTELQKELEIEDFVIARLGDDVDIIFTSSGKWLIPDEEQTLQQITFSQPESQDEATLITPTVPLLLQQLFRRTANGKWETPEEEQTLQQTGESLPKLEGESSVETPIGPQLLQQLLFNYRQHADVTKHFTLPAPATSRCFNQDQIKNKIRWRSPGTRLVEICGPSGIGKSHLLNSLASEEDRHRPSAHTDEWGNWKYIYSDRQGSYRQVMLDFIEKLGQSTPSDEDLPDILAQCITDAITQEKIDHFLFVLDNIDNISDDELYQLAGPNGPVGDNVKDILPVRENILLRLVFVSKRPRFPQLIRKKHNIRLLPLQMDALDFNAVQDMLEDRLKSVGLSVMTGKDILIRTERILEVSGGHPGIIAAILSELENRRFVLAPERYISTFRPLALQIVRTSIIGDLQLKEYLLLNVLSVLRHFRARHIQQLMERGFLPTDLIASEVSTKNLTEMEIQPWLDAFYETSALIRKPEYHDAPPLPLCSYIVHPILRHVLPMELEETNSALLAQLHHEAFTIYDDALRNRDSGGIKLLTISFANRSIYILEAIYHYTQYILVSHLATTTGVTLAPLSPDDLATDYMRLYLESYEATLGYEKNWFELREMWKRDENLQEQIIRLPQGEEILQRLNIIFTKKPDEVTVSGKSEA